MLKQYGAFLLDTYEKHLVCRGILAGSMIQAEGIAETYDDERYFLLEVAERNLETGNFIISVELMAKLPDLI